MSSRIKRTILATTIGVATVTLTTNSATASSYCNWMKNNGAADYHGSAEFHHVMAYGRAYYDYHHAFMKTGYHADHTKDIVDTAVSAGDFTTLVAAVKAAGLVDTLKGEGPFTVFAPTDEAFAKIPEAELDALLRDKEALTKILTYHIVPGKVTSAEVVKLATANTVEGQAITIHTDSGVKVNDANVVKTNIMTSNGVIHVIDTVLIPES
jgi:uncharacterized surface protein with fasciclin (FAS1) repeats